MKKFIIAILILALLGAVIIIYLQNQGYDIESVIENPESIAVSASCSPVTDLLLATETNLTITNNSSSALNSVMVKIKGYDANGELVKEKTTTFTRTLYPKSTLTKPITMPARTIRCECLVISSN